MDQKRIKHNGNLAYDSTHTHTQTSLDSEEFLAEQKINK